MWILKAAVCLAMPVLIAGQCDPKQGDKILDTKPASFLSDDSAETIAVWTEITASQTETTYTVREVYDKTTDRAFLEYFDGTQFQKILFDRKQQLFYSYTDSNCSKIETDGIANFYRRTAILRELRLRDVPAKGFLGPASIFDELSTSYVKIAQTEKCEIDRLIPCVQYKTCEGSPTNYWYSKDGYSLFGQTKSRPLRYVPESNLVVDVLSVQTYKKSQGLFIPTGLNCPNTLPAGTTDPLLSRFPTGRRSFSGEVVMSVDTMDKVLISKLDALILPSDNSGTVSGIYSFTSSTFKTSEMGDMIPDGETKVIHDVDHNIVFTRYTRDDPDEIALQETKCYVRPANDFQPELEFPTYGTISLLSIFLATPIPASDSKVSKLGANRIGTTDTEVIEVTYASLKTGNGVPLNQLIVSHHFDSLSGATVAVEINAFNISNIKIFSATIYINKYETTITKLNEKLRVDDCEEYQDSSESRWVEIGFEDASSGAVAQILGSAFQIREAFIEKLHSEYGVAPMRLPQVNVDFVDQQVLVKSLLLERPLLTLAYKDYWKKDFVKPTQVLGVMSLSACQITCLGMPHCTAISYCGATCSTSNASNPAAPLLTVNSDECFLYEREFAADIFPSSKILRDLQKDVTTPATKDSLKLRFATAAGDGSSGGSQDVEITAITFDDTKNFDGAFHYDQDKVAIVETSYTLAKPKRRFKTVSRASLLGSFVLEDCALACKNRPTCEAFSFCMNSMDCMISRDHDIDDNELEEDTACVAYQKKYVDRFERFPGLTILGAGSTTVVTGAESCAQMCVQRADCKSFEFCDISGECLLLTTHIADAKAVTKENNEAKCDHYSKRFLYDYAILPKTRGTGDKTTELASYTRISQAACAKLCSEWGNSNSTCLSFDFCGPQPDNTGTCTLRTVDGKQSSTDNTCSFLYLTVQPSEGIVKHGSGEAVGLSILMMIIGAGLAVGGLFLFNKYH